MREKLKAFVEKWRTSAKAATGVEECALCLSAAIEIHAILSESQWVPVTERLPRYGQRVFVINKLSDGEEEMMLAASYQYDDGKQWFMDVQTGFQFEGVTHWHEIESPEPPEKQA